jgi:hypothetical protein
MTYKNLERWTNRVIAKPVALMLYAAWVSAFWLLSHMRRSSKALYRHCLRKKAVEA